MTTEGSAEDRPVVSRLTRWTPRLVLGLGVIHVGYAIVSSWKSLTEIVGEGFVATVHGAERGYVIWFMAAGIALITFGAIAEWAVRATGRLPGPLGWGLVVLGLFVAVPEPLSGGWLVFVLGVLAIVATRAAARRS